MSYGAGHTHLLYILLSIIGIVPLKHIFAFQEITTKKVMVSAYSLTVHCVAGAAPTQTFSYMEFDFMDPFSSQL